MIYRANEATYDAKGRHVRSTPVSDVGRGILFVRFDGDTNGAVAIRMVNNVARFQRRISGVWQDTPLVDG